MDETIERIIAIITAPVETGESHAGFAAKERQLMLLIQQLSAVDALTLKQRLYNARANDPLTIAFTRLTGDRRDRIIKFLNDPARSVRPID